MQYSLGHRRPYNKVCSNYVMIQIMIIMFEHVRAELLRTFDHYVLNASQPFPHIRLFDFRHYLSWLRGARIGQGWPLFIIILVVLLLLIRIL